MECVDTMGPGRTLGTPSHDKSAIHETTPIYVDTTVVSRVLGIQRLKNEDI